MEILKRIADALQQGDDQQVATLAAEALGAGLPAGDVLQQGLVAGMNVVGEQFRRARSSCPTCSSRRRRCTRASTS
jgi:5-methyltetrahydrofolate--homocysteine methyltransferase